MGDLLFYRRGSLSVYLASHAEKVKADIEVMNRDRVLKTDEEELCKAIGEKSYLGSPVITIGEVYASEPQDIKVDISSDPLRAFMFGGQTRYMTGTRVTVHAPFDGNAEMFDYCPSSFTLNRPQGTLGRNEVLLTYDFVDKSEAVGLKSRYEADLGRINEYLQSVANDVGKHNDNLQLVIRSAVQARRQKLLTDASIADALGIPIKKGDGSSPT